MPPASCHSCLPGNLVTVPPRSWGERKRPSPSIGPASPRPSLLHSNPCFIPTPPLTKGFLDPSPCLSAALTRASSLQIANRAPPGPPGLLPPAPPSLPTTRRPPVSFPVTSAAQGTGYCPDKDAPQSVTPAPALKPLLQLCARRYDPRSGPAPQTVKAEIHHFSSQRRALSDSSVMPGNATIFWAPKVRIPVAFGFFFEEY